MYRLSGCSRRYCLITSIQLSWFVAWFLSYFSTPVNSQLLNMVTCGRTRFTEPTGTILSAGYNTGSYPSNVNCEYQIEMNAQEQVTFTFIELELESAGGGECYDFLKIISPSGEDSEKICGTEHEPYTVTAELAGDVLLELMTDDSENQKGFKIEYIKALADPCSPNPCNHDGTCTSVLGLARCLCTPGWTGQFCEEDINECLNTLNPICNEELEICINTPGSYLCERKSGTFGSTTNSVEFDVNGLFVDQETGNPCVLSENGRDLLENWMEEYRQWRMLLQDYAIKYDQWKNEECEGG